MSIPGATPSATGKAATIGGSGLAAFIIAELLTRGLKIAPDYAQEIVGVLTLATMSAHRWLAVWYARSDGQLAIRLRHWLGNPIP